MNKLALQLTFNIHDYPSCHLQVAVEPSVPEPPTVGHNVELFNPLSRGMSSWSELEDWAVCMRSHDLNAIDSRAYRKGNYGRLVFGHKILSTELQVVPCLRF